MYCAVTLTLCPITKKGKWPGATYQYPDLLPLISTFEKPIFALSFDQESGLKIFVEADSQKPSLLSLDKWQTGDSLELFIDTRASLEARTKHRFFHHFVLFPEMVEGISSRLFRLEDTLDNTVQADCSFEKGRIAYDVTIPWNLLDGFELEDKASFGFGFRLNRTGSPSLYFPVASDLIDRMPLLLSRIEVSS